MRAATAERIDGAIIGSTRNARDDTFFRGRRLEVNALVLLLGVWFGYGFWGIPGILLATPALVALKVAAQYRPSWRVVGDFLAPIGDWRPKSLRRQRVPKQAEEPPAPDRVVTRFKQS